MPSVFLPLLGLPVTALQTTNTSLLYGLVKKKHKLMLRKDERKQKQQKNSRFSCDDVSVSNPLLKLIPPIKSTR